MASLNRVTLIGNLGRDPELRSTQGGQQVAEFSIATSERWKDRGGEQQERTEWHRIVVWGPQAEHCAKYLAKGRSVCVEGKLQYLDWTDKEGNKRQTTEIVASNVVFLASGNGTGAGVGGERSSSAPAPRPPATAQPQPQQSPAPPARPPQERQGWLADAMPPDYGYSDDEIPF